MLVDYVTTITITFCYIQELAYNLRVTSLKNITKDSVWFGMGGGPRDDSMSYRTGWYHPWWRHWQQQSVRMRLVKDIIINIIN